MTARPTPYPGDCVECGQPLVSYKIKHGWVTVVVGWRLPKARVHTLCRRRFSERPLEEQQRMVKEAA